MKTIHRVEVEIDQNGVKIRKGSRAETMYSSGAPGYGSVFFRDTHVISAEGEWEPVDLLNDLRDFAHAILDQLEGV